MNKAIKLIIALSLFGVAGFMAYRYYTRPNPYDEVAKETMWFQCDKPACKTEWSMLAGEVWKVCKEQQVPQPPCPQCKSIEAYDIYMCPSCNKSMMPEGHGSRPKLCPSCKAVQPQKELPKAPVE